MDSWVIKDMKEDKKAHKELHQPGACDGSSEYKTTTRNKTLYSELIQLIQIFIVSWCLMRP